MTSRGVDLDEVRRNLVRLSAVQALLLLAVLGFIALSGPGDSERLARLLWVALLPLLLAAWAVLYYRSMRRAADAGGGDARYHEANRAALRTLGLFGGLWVAGLVVVLIVV